ncbi:MAG: YdgA family protein [Saprospiraceae bacterium]|nr:YdgA family protein [Saprospiraceae bacterium]
MRAIFSTNAFSLVSKANLISDVIQYEEQAFLPNKRISYDAKIAVNLKEGNYKVERATVSVEGNPFDLDGSVVMTEKYTDYDLIIKKNGGNLESVLQLLPEQYLAQLGDFSSKGAFYFNAFINGRSAKNLTPEIDVEFGLNDGQLNSPRMADSFRDVSFDARYNNGAKLRTRKSIFEITQFKGYFDRELVELTLRADDLENPMIDFTLNGAVPLKAIYGLFNNKNIKAGTGEIEVENLEIKGLYSDMQSPSTISRVAISGTARFDDASLTVNEEKMVLDRGELVLAGNDLLVNEVKLQGADSEILLNGSFTNWIPVMLADSLNTQQAALVFEATLDAPKMDLDRLIALTTAPLEEKKLTEAVVDSMKTEAIEQRESFTKFLKGKFTANVNSFNYGKINGQNFKGALQFDNNKMTIRGNTNAMEGTFSLNGEMYFEGKRYLKALLICQDIDGKQFFYESDNFGQDILTDKHLKGELAAKISIDAYWEIV